MGKAERRKGHQYERDIKNRFYQLDETSVRNYENIPGAILGIDVMTSKFNIQCKRGKKYSSVSKYFELPSDPTKIGLLIQKADRLPDMVTLKLKDFLEIINAQTEQKEIQET